MHIWAEGTIIGLQASLTVSLSNANVVHQFHTPIEYLL
jgi:hypothetical protein